MKKILFMILVCFVYQSAAAAADSLYLPCKKITPKQAPQKIESVEYDSVSGYDFTGKGKPRYNDPIYYNYYIEDPKYNLFYHYPAFYLPSVRGRGK